MQKQTYKRKNAYPNSTIYMVRLEKCKLSPFTIF